MQLILGTVVFLGSPPVSIKFFNLSSYEIAQYLQESSKARIKDFETSLISASTKQNGNIIFKYSSVSKIKCGLIARGGSKDSIRTDAEMIRRKREKEQKKKRIDFINSVISALPLFFKIQSTLTFY